MPKVKTAIGIYNQEGKRVQANGNLAGYSKDGNLVYKKGAPNAHLKSGSHTKIKISNSSWVAKTNGVGTILPKNNMGKITGSFAIIAIFLNLSSILTDSP